ncbi:RILP-like protein 1 [Entelurus aequoreus]|uniref:RILP-like protein 1 n=1 Tax=Entelurus aequoreus TaxID=161455 RepID=UPI002B1E4F46|nr:RILP-like protein 1 [Entelurus aequoreus]
MEGRHIPDSPGSALEKNVADLTVMDVYDIAAAVGQEFERIIDQYGCEALSRLMPKVVRVLEILEVMVSRHSIGPETDELRLELDKLRLERTERADKERKHRKELELVEDVWRGEAQDLLSQIALLQDENKSLLNNISTRDPMTEEDLQRHEGMSERERQVMKKLKEVVDKQRDEIRAKDRELTLKNEDIEAVRTRQSHVTSLRKQQNEQNALKRGEKSQRKANLVQGKKCDDNHRTGNAHIVTAQYKTSNTLDNDSGNEASIERASQMFSAEVELREAPSAANSQFNSSAACLGTAAGGSGRSHAWRVVTRDALVHLPGTVTPVSVTRDGKWRFLNLYAKNEDFLHRSPSSSFDGFQRPTEDSRWL